VGIIPGEKPQAIIENTQTQRTIYASQGERLEGILVESVTGGKVVLSDGNERFEMTL
jgi:UDP-N-acetylmuramyl pentapeptide synthase